MIFKLSHSRQNVRSRQRRREIRHAQPVRHRRQRDGDQRAVELEQRRRAGARGEPHPRVRRFVRAEGRFLDVKRF